VALTSTVTAATVLGPSPRASQPDGLGEAPPRHRSRFGFEPGGFPPSCGNKPVETVEVIQQSFLGVVVGVAEMPIALCNRFRR